jgi:hypothetical protein
MVSRRYKRAPISRDELLVLVGAGAGGFGPCTSRTDGNGAFSIFSQEDLNFIRDRSVQISRGRDGSVRVDVLKYGRPTV